MEVEVLEFGFVEGGSGECSSSDDVDGGAGGGDRLGAVGGIGDAIKEERWRSLSKQVMELLRS